MHAPGWAKRVIPAWVRRRVMAPILRRAACEMVDLGLWILGERDALVPPKRLVVAGQFGGGDYQAIGYRYLHQFTELGGLKPSDRVLEVGSGLGRMAIPVAGILNEDGAYEGLDVVPFAVKWCQDYITPRFPRFKFQLADVHNGTYNPSGKRRAVEYVFPFPDLSFDFVIFGSVFTHLRAEEAEHYLSEVRRVLRPGGRLFSTWYLLNEESRRLMAEHAEAFQVVHPMDGCPSCRTAYPERPEDLIGYDEGHVLEMLERCGLAVKPPVHYGSWSGRRACRNDQDVIVAERAADEVEAAG